MPEDGLTVNRVPQETYEDAEARAQEIDSRDVKRTESQRQNLQHVYILDPEE